MSHIVIDHELCARDGICIAECPARIIQEDVDGYPVLAPEDVPNCISCGHCLAVCPHAALTLEGVAPGDCLPMDAGPALSPEAVAGLATGRRSVRRYREEPVPHVTIEKLIDLARWAPTARNMQPVHWTVLDSREKTRTAAGLVADWFREVGVYPELVAAWDEGEDRILRGAPHLIVAHASTRGFRPAADCVIALSTLELAAHGMGLGACWAGYFMAAADAHDPVRELLGLPDGHQVYGALMLGLPRYRYRRVPPREAARVTWLP
ncbi:MAG: nitroreductase family protein [Actinobacteria bacterium]|nr:nitroreductase family protein [Actinomycetota bacterium]